MLLHRHSHVVVGGRRLDPDRGVFKIGEAVNLRHPGAVDDEAQRRRHIRIGPGQVLLSLRCDGDAADNAVVTPVLHLLQDHLPLGIDECWPQPQPTGNLLH